MTPRFEFRAFAQSFGLVAERIRRFAPCREITECTDVYLVAVGVDDRNVKLRDDRLQVKRRVEQRGQLQRWRPDIDEALPVARELVRMQLLSNGEAAGAELRRSVYTAGDLIREIVQPSRELWVATVFKRRFRFTIAYCPTEIDELLVNGAAIRSVGVESEDPDAVHAVVAELGLTDYENLDYPRAIRRIMGLEPWPNGFTHG